mgnify:CR=1 FL=1
MKNTIIPIETLKAALDLGFINRPWMDEVTDDYIFSVLATPWHQSYVEKVISEAPGLTSTAVA